MKLLWQILVAGKQKAVVGSVVAGVAMLLVQSGFSADIKVTDLVAALSTGLLNYVGVYVTKNK